MGTSSGTTSKTNAAGQIARALHASLKTKPPREPKRDVSITPKWARKYTGGQQEPPVGMTLEAWERALQAAR